MRRLLFLGLLAFLLSCEDNDPIPTTYYIDEELLPYLKTFLAEARSRAVEFKAENLIMEFGTAPDGICGQSLVSKNGGQRKITIVRNSPCWLSEPTENRESLVLHELSHCLLDRIHRDDILPNGAAASIMHSHNDGPYGPCLDGTDGDESCNLTARRTYYIEELFDPSTPVPEWGK